MTDTTMARPALLEALLERAHELAASGPEWLRTARRDALERIEREGFPTIREEAWKTTNPAWLTERAHRPASGGAPQATLPPTAELGLDGPRLVFVDGRFSEPLSRSVDAGDGVRVERLTELLERDADAARPFFADDEDDGGSAFARLNLALFDDGVLVTVDDGAVAARPIEIVHLSTGGDDAPAVFPRTLIRLGRDAQATVIEQYGSVGDGRSLTDAVSMSLLGDNARLDHARVQLEGAEARHVSRIWSRQGRDSRLVAHNVNLGGRVVRHDVTGILDGEGADCQLWGIYVTRDEQHVDNHTLLDHAKPHGDSREVYKGILDDASRAIFNGRIVVREDAQKTDAKQSNPNIVLSNRALASTRPQLEIYADDVKCTHGATVGRLDESQVFYLRSRGLSETDARRLLLEAFVGEVLDRLTVEPLRDTLREQIARRLPGGPGRSG